MNRIIIVKSGNESITYGFADAFAQNSVSTLICEKDDIEEVIRKYPADAVFSTSFDSNISDICLREKLAAVFWILSLPAPALFCPQIIKTNNTVFIPDERTCEIFRNTGLDNVLFPENCPDLVEYSGIDDRMRFLSDRIMMCLEKDEVSFLKGMLCAQQAFPDESILFRALNEDMISRMYSIAGLPAADIPIKKRYVISECILRPLVMKNRKNATATPGRTHDFGTAVSEILGTGGISAAIRGTVLSIRGRFCD
ncbi:MAG: hypothetical protein IJS86_02470 [Lachnospiraceae bacterium]|nr:hypothetical protein [Lachnospiraceae bacterium]